MLNSLPDSSLISSTIDTPTSYRRIAPSSNSSSVSATDPPTFDHRIAPLPPDAPSQDSSSASSTTTSGRRIAPAVTQELVTFNSSNDTASTNSDDESEPVAQTHFEQNNNSMKILLSMSVGLQDPQSPETVFADFQNDKRFPTKNKKSWNPGNVNLIDEIKRRKQMISDVSKTSAQMKKGVALTWLKKHPITNASDIKYILDKFTTFLIEVAAATNEKGDKIPGSAARPSYQWSGTIPFLRLIHAIVDFEDTRAAFLKDFNVMTREELDGHNNQDTTRVSPWILISDKWNDPDYNPKSTEYDDLHNDFLFEIDLGFSAIERMGALTPDKAKQKFFKLKNDLLIVKNNWERSGNGDGSRLEQHTVDSNADSDDETEQELMSTNNKRE